MLFFFFFHKTKNVVKHIEHFSIQTEDIRRKRKNTVITELNNSSFLYKSKYSQANWTKEKRRYSILSTIALKSWSRAEILKPMGNYCFNLDCNWVMVTQVGNQFLNIHWKDWCWSWNSNTLATWCEQLTHLKRLWCWERLKAGGEGDDRGWDGWMASPTQWTE